MVYFSIYKPQINTKYSCTCKECIDIEIHQSDYFHQEKMLNQVDKEYTIKKENKIIKIFYNLYLYIKKIIN